MALMRALFFRRAACKVLGLSLVFGHAYANYPFLSSPALDFPIVTVADIDSETDAGSNFDNLEIVDASLKEKLAVSRVGSDVGDNNLLSVFAGLKNRTSHRLALEVETIYRDKADHLLNTGSWIMVVLKPHEQTDYRSSSISEDAVDFLIRVRIALPPVVHTRN